MGNDNTINVDYMKALDCPMKEREEIWRKTLVFKKENLNTLYWEQNP